MTPRIDTNCSDAVYVELESYYGTGRQHSLDELIGDIEGDIRDMRDRLELLKSMKHSR